MNPDNALYDTCQKAELEKFESACRRCGECCGSQDGDPCLQLARDEGGAYYCRDYENRLGPQRTASGMIFECVPIREIINVGYPKANCAYNLRKADVS